MLQDGAILTNRLVAAMLSAFGGHDRVVFQETEHQMLQFQHMVFAPREFMT